MSDEEKFFEDILKKKYSPEISDKEKIVIHTMIRHLKRLLNWNAEENDSLFNKERGPEIVRDIMTEFNSWKFINERFFNHSVVYVSKLHLVIYKIAKLCFYYWIRDSQIVSEVLNEVYNADGHFSSMFTYIMHQNERRSMIPESNIETRYEEYLLMVYFLTQAHSTKLEFAGLRFVDFMPTAPYCSPVLWTAIGNKPQLLLLLLRYGANLDGFSATNQAYDWTLTRLLRHLIGVLWDSLETETEDTTVTRSIVNDRLLCLRFLLRGIRQIPIGELEFCRMTFDPNGDMVIYNSHDIIRSISEQGIVPKLMSRYLEPSELQHLCRLVIRDALNRNWNLPFGVLSLPLPKVLQRYVNLSED